MAEQLTGEVHAESEVSKTEEAEEECWKSQRKSHPERTPWKFPVQWDSREINAEELDAAILEHAKQAFVAIGIPRLHFV